MCFRSSFADGKLGTVQVESRTKDMESVYVDILIYAGMVCQINSCPMLTPIPSASVATAAAAKPGAFQHIRSV